jgi:hypothetical protein
MLLLKAYSPVFSQTITVEGGTVNEDCKLVRNVESPVLIRYADKVRCFIEIGQQEVSTGFASVGFREKISESLAGEITYFSMTNEGTTVSMLLDQNKDFELLADDECGNFVTVSKFSTKYISNTTLQVSSAAFDAIKQWNKNGINNFYDMIVSNPEIPVYEQIYILQEFMNDGTPFLEIYDNEQVPPIETFNKGNDCKCRTLSLGFVRKIESYEVCEPDIPNFHCTLFWEDENDWGANQSNNYLHRESHEEGPAKFYKIDGKARSCQNPYRQSQLTANGYAMLEFAMACADANWDRANCKCEIPVYINYSYNSKVRAYTNLPGQCGSPIYSERIAEAIADDAAIFMKIENDINDLTFEIDTLHRRTAATGCNIDINEQQLADMLSFIKAAYTSFKKPATAFSPQINEVLNTAWQTYFQAKALDYLNNVVVNPWVFNAGECGTDDDELTISGKRTYLLSVGNPVGVGLFTQSFLKAGGRVAFDVESKVTSAYRLTGVIGTLFPEKENPYCCSPPFAQYTLGSMSHLQDRGALPVSPISNIRNLVGADLAIVNGSFSNVFTTSTQTGGYVIPDEVATVQGKPIQDCYTFIERSGGEVMGSEEKFQLIQNGREIKIVNHANDLESVTYQVFNTQSVLIEQLNSSDKIIDFEYIKSYPSGFYFLKVTSGGQSQTFKILNVR